VATPTITNIYPATGHTGGTTMVRILGGGFAPNPDPAVTAYDDLPEGSLMTVSFGGVPSPYVAVVNSGLLYARAPVSPLSDKTGSGAGPVDVVIQNLDSNLEPIVGETATVVAGFAYEDAKLTGKSDLVRLIHALVIEMQRQVIRNVSLHTHTDFDSETGDLHNTVDVAKLPAIVLIGPQLRKPMGSYIDNTRVYVSGPEAVQTSLQPPYTRDLVFEYLGAGDTDILVLNLESILINFFKKTQYIEIDADGSDPSQGKVRFELVLDDDGAPNINHASNASNVRSFGGRFLIRGFTFTGVAGLSVGSNDGSAEVAGEFVGDDIGLLFYQKL
jgi:hypothetical protein